MLYKGADLSRCDQTGWDPIADQLNNRPRKTSGWRNPLQAAHDLDEGLVKKHHATIHCPSRPGSAFLFWFESTNLYYLVVFLMRTNLPICIFLVLLLNVSPAYSYRILTDASPSDKVQLPKFCWAQAGVPGAVGSEFRINNCPGANHYCIGLLNIQYAKKESNAAKRITQLKDGLRHIRYTESRTSKSPKCEIHAHVVAKRIEVEALLRIYGVQSGQ